MFIVFLLPIGFLYSYTPPPNTPLAQCEVSGNETVNWTITIIEIDFEIPLNDTEYYLRDTGGVAVPGEQGSVEDIVGLNRSGYVTIAFDDADGNWQLSVGDSFWLQSREYSGPSSVGYSLRMAYGVTGDTICEKTLSNN